MSLCVSTFFIFGHTSFLENKVYNQSIINQIPKIIHQIWVGKKPLPEEYKRYAEKAKALHPDWEYKLWTDEDVNSFPWTNKRKFKMAENPGMKSDIWRYEILYQFGGLYLDMDVECIRPFDPMHERLQFYIGNCSQDSFLINISVIGSVAKSEILKNTIKELKRSSKKIENEKICTFDKVLNTTGPRFFTDIVKKNFHLFKNPRYLILPCSYFQPTLNTHGGIAQTEKELFDLTHTCFANHRNGCSWVEPNDFIIPK